MLFPMRIERIFFDFTNRYAVLRPICSTFCKSESVKTSGTLSRSIISATVRLLCHRTGPPCLFEKSDRGDTWKMKIQYTRWQTRRRSLPDQKRSPGGSGWILGKSCATLGLTYQIYTLAEETQRQKAILRLIVPKK